MSDRVADEALAPGSARLFTDSEMDDALCFRVGGGVAAVYSSRSPVPKNGDSGALSANQDGAAVFELDPGCAVLAVADGLGGQPGGASASRLTLEALQGSLSSEAGASGPARVGILDGIESANRSVLELGIGAGTTVAAAEILLGTMRPYHVGDSEILVVGQRGRIKLQTVPHSPVGYAVESGMLDQEEAMHHDERHYVSNLVGSAEMRIEIGTAITLAPRDTLLLATDGLFDNLSVAEVVEKIRTGPLRDVARRLIDACRARMTAPAPGDASKPDDLTFILYRRR